jgi:hypothetical protein
VLRPGGVLVATVPANPWRYDWFDKWVGHLRRYTEAGMSERLREAGFDVVAADGWGFPVTGFYHRFAYRTLLRRRMRAQAGRNGAPAGSPGLLTRVLMRGFRVVLELDSLFIGRRPGYFGLLVCAEVAPER